MKNDKKVFSDEEVYRIILWTVFVAGFVGALICHLISRFLG